MKSALNCRLEHTDRSPRVPHDGYRVEPQIRGCVEFYVYAAQHDEVRFLRETLGVRSKSETNCA